MLTIIYDPINGVVPPDNKLKQTAEDIINNYIHHDKRDLIIIFGSECHIDVMRLCVMESKLHHTEVNFMYQDYSITMDRYGKLSHYPWNGVISKTLRDLIHTAEKVRKGKEETNGKPEKD